MSKALKLKKSYTLNDNNIAICKNKNHSSVKDFNLQHQKAEKSRSWFGSFTEIWWV
jgi:galactose mutarotase-like enzyme